MTLPIGYTARSVVAPPGLSQAMRAGGLIFVSGQVALDADGAVVGVGDVAEQTRQVFRNIGLVLDAAGSSFAHLVKLTYFVRDVASVPAIRAVRDEFVNTANPPASSLVEISGLFMPDLLIEIEAVANS